MISEKQIKVHVQGLLFETTKHMTTHAEHDLYKQLSKELNKLLQTSFIGFYMYNQWNHSYELISNGEPKEQFLQNINPYILEIEKIHHDQHIIDGKGVFPDGQMKQDLYIFTLNEQVEQQTEYCIIQFRDKRLSTKLLRFIHGEIEQFTKLLYAVHHQAWKQTRSELLNHWASRLFSTPRRAKVLEIIVENLHAIYPDFEYYILLSQDYEKTCALPIKELEITKISMKRGSNEAFLSGEIQIEKESDGTFVYAPLRGNQGIYGVIEIIASQDISFPHKEIEFINKFSLIAGQALENVTLYQSSTSLVSDLKLINQATQKLNANVHLSELMSTVKQQINDACAASEIGFIFIQEDDEVLFEIEPESTSYFQTDQGLSVVEFLLAQMKLKTEIFTGNFTNYFPETTFESVMLIPMIQSGQIHGCIVIMHEEKSYFSFENFKLMQSLIQHFTLAITNTILKTKLEKAVITDYLTKLYSRNHLDDMIKKHMETDEYGSLILFDIDDFKKINDTYGHFIGDEVIIQVANILKMNIDQEDIPTRWGGEELAIYLPHETLQDSGDLAEKIRTQVERESEPKVTLSCGVSMWSNNEEDSVSDLFVRADQSLYAAKEGGKNQVATEDMVLITEQ